MLCIRYLCRYQALVVPMGSLLLSRGGHRELMDSQEEVFLKSICFCSRYNFFVCASIAVGVKNCILGICYSSRIVSERELWPSKT